MWKLKLVTIIRQTDVEYVKVTFFAAKYMQLKNENHYTHKNYNLMYTSVIYYNWNLFKIENLVIRITHKTLILKNEI